MSSIHWLFPMPGTLLPLKTTYLTLSHSYSVVQESIFLSLSFPLPCLLFILAHNTYHNAYLIIYFSSIYLKLWSLKWKPQKRDTVPLFPDKSAAPTAKAGKWLILAKKCSTDLMIIKTKQNMRVKYISLTALISATRYWQIIQCPVFLKYVRCIPDSQFWNK